MPIRRKTGISKMSRVIKKDISAVKICVRKMFQNYCYRIVEFFLLKKLNKDNVDNFIQFEGLEYLDKALNEGKGGIIVTPHLGNCELGCAGLLIKGYPIIPLAWDIPNKQIDRLFRQIREKVKMNTIHPDQKGIRQVITGLKENKLIGIVSDVGGGKTGIQVKFFDRLKPFSIGPVKLAMLTGAYIIPGYSVRIREGKIRVIIEEPMILDRKENHKEELLINTQKLAQKIECYIRKCPEQWFWLPEEEAKEEILA
jgi:KDO2-lipid IV(A) lauroyltransferase